MSNPEATASSIRREASSGTTMSLSQSIYADTAYNSENPRDLPPAIERSGDVFFINKALGKPLSLPRKAHCCEFLSEGALGSQIKRSRRLGPWATPPTEDNGPHERFIWGNIFEWPIFIRVLNLCFGIILLVGGGGGVLFMLITLGIDDAIALTEYLFIPFIIWLSIKLMTRKEPNLKTDTRFLRRTGMINVYLSKNKREEYRFDEFDPYVSFTTGPTGSTNFTLNLGHRYSDLILSHHNSFMDEFSLNIEWEKLCALMDTSQPLPEIPEYEQCRHWDPVSKAFDEKNNRPRDYWYKMNTKTIKALSQYSWRAARDYPWGITRQQALVQGWKPSEQRWREEQEAKKQARINEHS